MRFHLSSPRQQGVSSSGSEPLIRVLADVETPTFAWKPESGL